MVTDKTRRRADAERNAETILSVTRGLLVAGTVPAMSEVAAAGRGDAGDLVLPLRDA
ncbi:hypothetical protein [Kribbella qitaiheensis]|uniref:hypothetical protein n=1 Tax=Kribbella qitaiheensis TaxID=1544730 RepID=UPI0016273ADA|nr:hypothetical protein [Kribbella qitaiheensis]